MPQTREGEHISKLHPQPHKHTHTHTTFPQHRHILSTKLITSSSILSTRGLLSTFDEIGIVGMIGDSIGSVELLLFWLGVDGAASLVGCGFGVAGLLEDSLPASSSSSEDIVTVSVVIMNIHMIVFEALKVNG